MMRLCHLEPYPRMRPLPETAVYALLDDSASGAPAPTSRLYTDHAHTRVCINPDGLDALWALVEADQRAGLHALLLADYEWGARLMRAGHTRWTPVPEGGLAPALQVLLFRSLRKLTATEVAAWLAAAEGATQPGPAGSIEIRSDCDREGFGEAMRRIQEALRAGDTYQVNYTLRLACEVFGSPLALFRRLRTEQPVPYAALLALPDGRHVLSLSPELFLRHDGGEGNRLLKAQPMKGTAARAQGEGAASEAAKVLASDAKNRAENVMIVDLLRNDLGRIAEAGSVRVSDLFSVATCGTLFQMTSTIEAQLVRGASFGDVLRATFPCGSITGAPKHRTMQIIAGLEHSPRGLYCGAIGWVDASPSAESMGAFCLSVAIRTLVIEAARTAGGTRPARLGVGAGIVLNSDATSEFEEIGLKARFFTNLDPGFSLFETMLASRATGVRHLDLHLARLTRSAGQLRFRLEPRALRTALLDRVAQLPPEGHWRLRLALAWDGRLEFLCAPLDSLRSDQDEPGVVRIALAEEPVRADAFLAGHKTDWRPQYDPALHMASARGCFDQLFFTGAGELVEGTRSNVFVKLQGRWYTPPLSSGALPGIMRGLLLADPAWAARERCLHRSDLRSAEQVVVCNALRGPLRARLVEDR